MRDFFLNSEIMARTFALRFQWQRLQTNVSFELEKDSLFSHHQTQVQLSFQRLLLLCCIYRTFFSHLTSSLPSLPPSLVSLCVLPHMASSCVSVPTVVCLNHFSLLMSSSVLCTFTGGFLVLFWMMCWSTLLHPAWPFLTPSRVLPLALEFAAIGSTVDVWPGSQDQLSRSLLLLSALNLPVCYPGALTPTVYLLHSKYFDCPLSIFSGKHCSQEAILCFKWQLSRSGFWSWLEWCNYRSRRTQLQQLPHLEAIRFNETLFLPSSVSACQMDFRDRVVRFWGSHIWVFLALWSFFCVVFLANGWNDTSIQIT